jgi:hypothetical protein
MSGRDWSRCFLNIGIKRYTAPEIEPKIVHLLRYLHFPGNGIEALPSYMCVFIFIAGIYTRALSPVGIKEINI